MTAEKPRLRGVSHQFAAFAAVVAGVVLVAMAPTSHAVLAAAIYAVSLVAMFGISGAYHRGRWSPRARAAWQRADHAMICAFIAGTYTPICVLAIGGDVGLRMLVVIWAGAAVGIVRALFWPRAPRLVVAAIYVGIGWLALADLRAITAALGTLVIALIAAGGVLYTVGAAIYAARRPDPAPRVFGYHEVFHALVIGASVCHFAAVVVVVRAA